MNQSNQKKNVSLPGPFSWLMFLALILLLYTAQSFFVERHIADWDQTPGYLESKKFEESVWHEDGIQRITYYYSGSYLYEVDGEIRRGFLLEFPAQTYGNAKDSRTAHAELRAGLPVTVTHGPTADQGSYIVRNRTKGAEFSVAAFPYAAGFFTLSFLGWIFFERRGLQARLSTLGLLLFALLYTVPDVINADEVLESDEVAQQGTLIVPYLKTLSEQPGVPEPHDEDIKPGMTFEETIAKIGPLENIELDGSSLKVTYKMGKKRGGSRTLTFKAGESSTILVEINKN